MQKKHIIIGVTGLTLLTALILFLSSSTPLTQGTISGYPITINKTLTISQSDGSDYIDVYRFSPDDKPYIIRTEYSCKVCKNFWYIDI